MSRFADWSIKNKILTIVFLIVFLELVLFSVSMYFLNSVSSRLTRLVDVDAEKIILAANAKTSMLEIHRAQKNIILHPTLEMIDRQIAHKNHAISELRVNLAHLDRLAEQHERASIVVLNGALEMFLRIDRQIEALSVPRPEQSTHEREEAKNTAIALSVGSARETYDQASQAVNTIISTMDAALDEHRRQSGAYFQIVLTWMMVFCLAGAVAGWLLGLWVARKVAVNLDAVIDVTDAIAGGRLDTPVSVQSGDETGRLAMSVKNMQRQLIAASQEAAARDWTKTGIARINDVMRGQIHLPDLCRDVIREIALYLEAAVGAIFLAEHKEFETVLAFSGGYACGPLSAFPGRFRAGEGLVGQAALSREPITIKDVPPEYIKVCSGLGEGRPAHIIVAPLLFEDQASGVAELGFFQQPTDLQHAYLLQVLPAVALTIETLRGRQKLSESLARAQVMAEELQQQQDELKAANEELEEQTQRLKRSEEKLKQQQNDLEEANAELEEKNKYLQNQKEVIERTNSDLEQARLDIEEKAEQLALSSRYKSEFLANMSHELRTPLNSILLLARMLSDNSEANLTPEQIRSAEIIYGSGNDLLSLINEVLDLSKIEAGRMDLKIERIPLQELKENLLYRFDPLAREKGLSIEVVLRPECPPAISSDPKRIDQILRNLISNALKFTEKGGVRIEIGRIQAAESVPAGLHRENAVAIAVSDTGIGIPADKQQIVFEAFQQLDTGTARRFPGTGLGLSICRNLAHLLGGDIQLESRPGGGSTFTLVLPDEFKLVSLAQPAAPLPVRQPPAPKREVNGTEAVAARLPDDRAALGPDEAAILIIEDDPNFAAPLMELCRQKKFKVLYAATGEQGLELAHAHQPKGILLDIHLPHKDGWDVLDHLKQNIKTRHIPVHIISADEVDMEAFAKGAVGFLTKPVEKQELENALSKLENVFERQIKDLLVVEDDAQLRRTIISLIGNSDVHANEAGNAAEAIAALRAKPYDCMILDLGLPDMNGLDMLRLIQTELGSAPPPVIIYTGKELTRDQEAELQRYSESIIIKGVRSEERLYDEASLFLHRIVEKMPEKKRRLITNLYDTDVMFRDKEVLIADDDMRSAFALSKLLEEKGVRVLKAENGRKAIDLLESHPDLDLILMDMMMPVMDGYEAMRCIRSLDQWRTIPIIALTAKAMKSDRERCIQAGASDYLTKPVDMGRLFSMLRVWLYR